MHMVVCCKVIHLVPKSKNRNIPFWKSILTAKLFSFKVSGISYTPATVKGNLST